jgi:hypothetical protein
VVVCVCAHLVAVVRSTKGTSAPSQGCEAKQRKSVFFGVSSHWLTTPREGKARGNMLGGGEKRETCGIRTVSCTHAAKGKAPLSGGSCEVTDAGKL